MTDMTPISNFAALRVQGNQITLTKSDLITYGAAAVTVVLVIVAAWIAAKTRKRSFIRTIPTNLKERI